MDTKENTAFKTALVALDLTEIDEHVLRYTAMLSKHLELERIYFVHIAKRLALSEELLEKFPKLSGPVDESIETGIQERVDAHFAGQDVITKSIVQDGAPVDGILKLVKIKQVDLVIVGQKKSYPGSGIVSGRLARKCPCSLLFVTEQDLDNIKLDKILVPVDFSNHSYLALKRSQELAEASGASLAVSHVYNIPMGYYKTGKTFEEFSEIMKQNAEEDFNRFLTRNELSGDFNCTYKLTKDGTYASCIHDHAYDTEVDLIVTGSKGKRGSTTTSMLLGSVAEKLVFLDAGIPVLIIKSEGENTGILEALFRG